MAFGTRGDGKTQGAFGAMLVHAQHHHAAGFPLPTRWLGATGTFQGHLDKTCESMRDQMWRGLWTLSDGGHRAHCAINGTELVRVTLFGTNDPQGLERLRAECHGVWFEEPAPAAEIGAHGMSEDAWGMAISSMRLPSHANVAMATSNYPDEEHWTWTRFVRDQYPGTWCVRIVEGERATAEQRAAWAEAIRDPVMRRRLLEGKPGTIIPGRPVASPFNEDVHVARGRLVPQPGADVYIGQDGGLAPATVIAQRAGAKLQILAGLTSQHAGIRQHFRYVVLPWLGEHMPWSLEDRERLHCWYDPSLDTDSQADSETNPLRVMRELLPAIYRPGPVQWIPRRDPMLAALSAMDEGTPLVQLDPTATALVKTLRGMWHYALTMHGTVRKEEPKKPDPPWADLGDAFCYLVAGAAPLKPVRDRNERPTVRMNWDVMGYERPALPKQTPTPWQGIRVLR